MYYDLLKGIYCSNLVSSEIWITRNHLDKMVEFLEYCKGLGLGVRINKCGGVKEDDIQVYIPGLNPYNKSDDILVIIWSLDGEWTTYNCLLHMIEGKRVIGTNSDTIFRWKPRPTDMDIGIETFKEFVNTEYKRYKEMLIELKKEKLQKDFV